MPKYPAPQKKRLGEFREIILIVGFHRFPISKNGIQKKKNFFEVFVDIKRIILELMSIFRLGWTEC